MNKRCATSTPRFTKNSAGVLGSVIVKNLLFLTYLRPNFGQVSAIEKNMCCTDSTIGCNADKTSTFVTPYNGLAMPLEGVSHWGYVHTTLSDITSEDILRFYTIYPELLTQSDEHGHTVTTRAARDGDLDTLIAIFDSNSDYLFQCDEHGWTPATIAAHCRQSEVLELIYYYSPSAMFQPDQTGCTPATNAAKNGGTKVLYTLHQLDETVLFQFDQHHMTPATQAAIHHNSEVLRFLYQLNPKLLSVYDKSKTPASHHSLIFGNQTLLTELLFDTHHDTGLLPLTTLSHHAVEPYIELLKKVKDEFDLVTAFLFEFPHVQQVLLSGDTHSLRQLYQIDPHLFSQTVEGGWTLATKATSMRQHERLTSLHSLDPKLLSQPDQRNRIPLMLAANNMDLDTLKLFHQLNPRLFFDTDHRGFTVASKAARMGNTRLLEFLFSIIPYSIFASDKEMSPEKRAIEAGQTNVLKVIFKVNPVALMSPAPSPAGTDLHIDSHYSPHQYTHSTYSGYYKRAHNLDTFHELPSDLLLQEDFNGNTPGTLSVQKEAHDLSRLLYRLNPDYLYKKNSLGQSAFSLDQVTKKLDVINTLRNLETDSILDSFTQTLNANEALPEPHFELDPFFVYALAAIPSLVLSLCIAIRCFSIFSSDRHTHIDVHSDNRDARTFEAYERLKLETGTTFNAHHYFIHTFLPQLGLRANAAVLGSDNHPEWAQLKGQTVFYILDTIANDDELNSQLYESLITDVLLTDTQVSLKVAETNEKMSHLIFDFKKKTTTYNGAPIQTHLISTIPPEPSFSNSPLYKAFQTNFKFKYGLGFAANALNHTDVFKPLLFSAVAYVPFNNTLVIGRNILMRTFHYCIAHNDPKEVSLRLAAFIGGVSDFCEKNHHDDTVIHRLCELGQMQRLFITTLQGRLPGVLIDNVTNPQLKAIIPTVADLVNECCHNVFLKEKLHFKEDILAYVDSYIATHPYLSNPQYTSLKDQFIKDMASVCQDYDSKEPAHTLG